MRVRAKECVNDHVFDQYDHQGLSPGTCYEVIAIEYDCFRIAGDDDDPVLYPQCLFEVIDPAIPSSWVERRTEDYFYHGPATFGVPGFWEDFHDGNAAAISTFRRYQNCGE